MAAAVVRTTRNGVQIARLCAFNRSIGGGAVSPSIAQQCTAILARPALQPLLDSLQPMRASGLSLNPAPETSSHLSLATAWHCVQQVQVREWSRGGVSSSRRFSSAAASSEGEDRVVEVGDEGEFDKLFSTATGDGGKGAVLYFTAKWCGPCRMIAPHFANLSKEHPDIAFVKVDIDKEPLADVVKRYDITAVPTFDFCSSKGVKRATGADINLLKHGVAELAEK